MNLTAQIEVERRAALAAMRADREAGRAALAANREAGRAALAADRANRPGAPVARIRLTDL